MKKEHTALWNGRWGARMVHVPNSVGTKVLSFVRRNEQSQVFAVFNLSAEAQTVTFHDALYPGEYTDYFAGKRVQLEPETELTLEPWAYRVYLR